MTFLTGYEITRSIESNYSVPACLIGLLRRAVVTILSIVRIPGRSEIGPVEHNPHYRGVDLSEQLLRTRKSFARGMSPPHHQDYGIRRDRQTYCIRDQDHGGSVDNNVVELRAPLLQKALHRLRPN